MNISVFGLGYVGCVSLGCLSADGHNVIGVETNATKINLINSGKATVFEKGLGARIKKGIGDKTIRATNDYKSAVNNSKISIVCVGTPSAKNGNLDLSHLFTVAEQIGEALRDKKKFHIISIRSSVPPGTISKIESIISAKSGKEADIEFSVIANPEFLREGSAVNDYYNPPYTLIGGRNKSAMKKLSSIYKKVKGEVIYTDIANAELIKFVNNSFHALKVGFANEIGNICSALKIDSHEFVKLFTKDKKLNISSAYLKPGFAYGGSCLPKDLKALKYLSKQLLLNNKIIENISASNEELIVRAYKLIADTKKKHIGFIGITFKEGTDDVRNSPYISLIKKVIKEKTYSAKIFDNNINFSNIIGANKEFLLNEIPNISDLLVSDLNMLINSSDIIVIGSSNIKLKTLLKSKDKIVIDLVRVDKNMKTKNNYIGISW